MSYKIEGNHVTIPKLPGRLKKITGTRLASILGLNVWNTPFQAWCDMTKVYSPPFEDSIYTLAGKAIEPIIINYLKKELKNVDVVDGEEYWGADFAKRRFDYFPDEPIFGGMWDALMVSKKTKKPVGIIEIKTTKRAEDWQHEIPPYYKIQAMLYAKLLGVKTVRFAVAFLNDKDYENPHHFVANSDTVKMFSFRLDDEEIQDYLDRALAWHDQYIKGLQSPEWDEKKDVEALTYLRTNFVETDESLEGLLKTLDEHRQTLDALKPIEKLVKETEEKIKDYLKTQFGPSDQKVTVASSLYEITVSKSVSVKETFDLDTFTLDHPDLYGDYKISTSTETYRQAIKKKEK